MSCKAEARDVLNSSYRERAVYAGTIYKSLVLRSVDLLTDGTKLNSGWISSVGLSVDVSIDMG
jgi:hypothetical protein